MRSGREPSAEQLAEERAERSRQWAAPPPAVAADTLVLLLFTLGEETYAVELAHVDTVLPIRQLTPLPGTPDFVRGIVGVRGRVVSVLDLRLLFALPRRGLADRNHLVVLRSAEMEFGLLADRIVGVQSLDPALLQTEQAGLAGLRRSVLRGIGPQQWQVLDGARLLAEPSLRIDDND
ncbi:chemotaxis protein CheW [Chitinimonas koreensis]|uniref:chemotaxis protein CheW n=1 Tax=Chitinimonas koreensis TaxID=356302 RepID=UPI000684F7FB|nr:chemotaxis protein CheW [Chitinimonas koreensis]QNM97540.1 chemotaxis protein CheW [Chitinimonas koreensis]